MTQACSSLCRVLQYNASLDRTHLNAGMGAGSIITASGQREEQLQDAHLHQATTSAEGLSQHGSQPGAEKIAAGARPCQEGEPLSCLPLQILEEGGEAVVWAEELPWPCLEAI